MSLTFKRPLWFAVAAVGVALLLAWAVVARQALSFVSLPAAHQGAPAVAPLVSHSMPAVQPASQEGGAIAPPPPARTGGMPATKGPAIQSTAPIVDRCSAYAAPGIAHSLPMCMPAGPGS